MAISAGADGAARRPPVRALLLFAALAVLLGQPGAARADRLGYVVNEDVDRIAEFNTAADSLTGRTFEVADPHNVTLTPDGTKLLVTSPDGIVPIDRVTGTVGAPIAAGDTPEMSAVTPDGKTVLVVNRGSGDLSRFDLATGQPAGAAIPVGLEPRALAIAPDGGRAYVADYLGDDVYVVDVTAGQTVGEAIPVGNGPRSVAIAPDGSRVYVANVLSDDVTVIAAATGQVVGDPIPAGDEPESVTVAPDGATGWIVNPGLDSIRSFSTATAAPAGPPIEIGHGSPTLAITPGGRKAFTANGPGQAIQPVDLITRLTGSPFADTGGPGRIAITPDQPPVAALTVSPADGQPGTPVTFDASGSTDQDGTIARYDWDFGDGGVAVDGGPRPTHAYAAPGTYRARVTLTDDEGCSTGYVSPGVTAYCNGSGVATGTVAVRVSPRPEPPVPDNAFAFGRLKLNKKKGTATLRVKVPGAGRVALAGKTVKRAVRRPRAKSTVTLPVRAKGRSARNLKLKGKTKVRAKVTFTPAGGEPRSRTRVVRLIRR